MSPLTKKVRARLDDEGKFAIVIKGLLGNDPEISCIMKSNLVVILDALRSGNFDEMVEASKKSARRWDRFITNYPRVSI